MDHKITINNKEYDTRDFNSQQSDLLTIIQVANGDIQKASARLALMQTGREGAIQALFESLEKPVVEKGEADD